MNGPLPVDQVVEVWLKWAGWVGDKSIPEREQTDDLDGWFEFNWLVEHHPEAAWSAILAIVSDPRAEPFLGILAAGPMEDLLSHHGEKFIDRVESSAKSDPIFARMLGGVWKFQISDAVWKRIQAVRDTRDYK